MPEGTDDEETPIPEEFKGIGPPGKPTGGCIGMDANGGLKGLGKLSKEAVPTTADIISPIVAVSKKDLSRQISNTFIIFSCFSGGSP